MKHNLTRFAYMWNNLCNCKLHTGYEFSLPRPLGKQTKLICAMDSTSGLVLLTDLCKVVQGRQKQMI